MVKQNYVDTMFSLGDNFRTQVNAVLMADEILQDLKDQKAEKLSRLDHEIELSKLFEDKVADMNTYRNELCASQAALSKENEGLKLKFSQLLDQFQEYVNESEKKMEEEQFKQQETQAKLIADLNSTIKDLDELSKCLQQDVAERDEQIAELNLQKSSLAKELEHVASINKNNQEIDEIQKQKIKNLNDEAEYLKGQFAMEIDAMREENKCLTIRIREQSQEMRQHRGHRSKSPYEHYHGSEQDISQGDVRLNRHRSYVDYGEPRMGQYHASGHKNDSEGGHFGTRSKSQDRVTGKPGERGQSLGFEMNKRDLIEKERLIEQKNREIVKLRMENDELRHRDGDKQINLQQRGKIVSDFSDVIENLRSELERIKLNLGGKDGRSLSPMQNFREAKPFQEFPSENALLTALIDKLQHLRQVSATASEVFLQSGKQKYHGKFGTSQIQMSETEYQQLLQENGQLQRQIQQYEKIEKINLQPDSAYELQRLSQAQAKEILSLQKENTLMQEKLNEKEYPHINSTQLHTYKNENRVLKQELALLREAEARGVTQSNDEFINERRNLTGQIEQLEMANSETNKCMQDYKQQVQERDAQLEELRTRITTVAELFEKKPIKQRYSFEVLYDFVHDKAKRLFNKYDNAIKDKKSLQAQLGSGAKLDQPAGNFDRLCLKVVIPVLTSLVKF